MGSPIAARSPLGIEEGSLGETPNWVIRAIVLYWQPTEFRDLSGLGGPGIEVSCI